jgi:protein-tyrosine phosphatase
MSRDRGQPGQRIGVLFVCYANMCRSPLAEGVFRHLVAERGLEDEFEVESAGVHALDGHPPHPNSMLVAERHGVALTSLSRALVPADLAHFDHILAMDRENLADILILAQLAAITKVAGGRPQIRLLRAAARPDAKRDELDVPDPIGDGTDRYEEVYEIILEGCRALLGELAPEPR